MQPQVTFDDYCHYGLVMFGIAFALFSISYVFYYLTNHVVWRGAVTNFLVAYFFGMAYTIGLFIGGIFLFFALLDIIFIVTGVIHK